MTLDEYIITAKEKNYRMVFQWGTNNLDKKGKYTPEDGFAIIKNCQFDKLEGDVNQKGLWFWNGAGDPTDPDGYSIIYMYAWAKPKEESAT